MDDRRGVYYEKIFNYVKRFFNDTNNFLLDNTVKYINDTNLALSTRNSLYNKFYNIYISNLQDSSFYFFTTDMCLELESLMRGFLRGYTIEDDGKTYQLFELINALGFTSWVEKFKLTLSNNAVLVTSPVNGVDINLWSNSNPVGFMFRELSDPSYFYDHSAFYDFFKYAFEDWNGVYKEYQYDSDPSSDFQTTKEEYDTVVKNWLQSDKGYFADTLKNILSETFVDVSCYDQFNILNRHVTNETALAILSYINFTYIKFFILKENVISMLINLESPIVNEDSNSNRANIYDYKSNLDSFLETMSDMMNVCRNDLIAYTIEQINTFNETV